MLAWTLIVPQAAFHSLAPVIRHGGNVASRWELLQWNLMQAEGSWPSRLASAIGSQGSSFAPNQMTG